VSERNHKKAEGEHEDRIALFFKSVDEGLVDDQTAYETIEQLSYYGQTSTLLDAMRIIRPLVKESKKIISWSIDQFAVLASKFEIFDQVERDPSIDPGDPGLIERIQHYINVDREELDRFIGHLTGRQNRSWSIADFELKKSRDTRDSGQKKESGEGSLYYFSIEFLGYLRNEGVPYTKGEICREQILRYIQRRHDGELEPRENLFEYAYHSGVRRRERPRPRGHQLLCPDRGSLDRYLGRLMKSVYSQYYRSAAMVELLPSWLSFLESHRLISLKQRARIMQELRGIDESFIHAMEIYSDDPTPRLEVKRMWERE
jgi:hypothetical protein